MAADPLKNVTQLSDKVDGWCKLITELNLEESYATEAFPVAAHAILQRITADLIEYVDASDIVPEAYKNNVKVKVVSRAAVQHKQKQQTQAQAQQPQNQSTQQQQQTADEHKKESGYSVKLTVIKSMSIQKLHTLSHGGKSRSQYELRPQLSKWLGDIQRIASVINCRKLNRELQKVIKEHAQGIVQAEIGTESEATTEDEAMPQEDPIVMILEGKVIDSLGSGLAHIGTSHRSTELFIVTIVRAVLQSINGNIASRLSSLGTSIAKKPETSWSAHMTVIESSILIPKSRSEQLFAQLLSTDKARLALSEPISHWSSLPESKDFLRADEESSVPSQKAWESFRQYVASNAGTGTEITHGSVNAAIGKRLQKLESAMVNRASSSSSSTHPSHWNEHLSAYDKWSADDHQEQNYDDEDEMEVDGEGENEEEEADANYTKGIAKRRKLDRQQENTKHKTKTTQNTKREPPPPSAHPDAYVSIESNAAESEYRKLKGWTKSASSTDPKWETTTCDVEGECSCMFVQRQEALGKVPLLLDFGMQDLMDADPTCKEVGAKEESRTDETAYSTGVGESVPMCSCCHAEKTSKAKQAQRLPKICKKCEKWIADSGASHHMVGKCHMDMIEEIDYSRPISLKTADGTSSKPGYHCRLSRALRSRGLLTGVYHEDITQPLLSIRRLLRDRKVTQVAFELTKMTFTLKSGEKVVEKMSEEENLPLIAMPTEESYYNLADADDGVQEESHCNLVDADDGVQGEFACTAIPKKLQHLRFMHIHTKAGKGCGKDCVGCWMGRTTTTRGKQERPEAAAPKAINDRVACDFVGPWPKSYFGNTQLFVMVDDYDKLIECFATESRTCCGEFLSEWVRRNGRMNTVRSDNAREFKETRAPLRAAAEKWLKDGEPIKVEHSPPYSPWANGLAERTNRTVIEIVRSSLAGVDPLVWDLCATAAAHTINRVLVRKWKPPGTKVPKVAKTAYELRYGAKAATGYFRRFGCLCFLKQEHPEDKTAPRKVPGMFVGYAPNGAWKVLCWKEDKRTSAGYRLTIEESKQVAFDESILVRDVSLLKDFAVKVGAHDLGSGVLRSTSNRGSVSLGNQMVQFDLWPGSDPSNGSSNEEVLKKEMERSKIDDLTQGAIDKDLRKTEELFIESICGSSVPPSRVSEGVQDGDLQVQNESLSDKEIHEVIHNGDDNSGKTEASKSEDGIQVTVKRRGRPRKHVAVQMKNDEKAKPKKAESNKNDPQETAERPLEKTEKEEGKQLKSVKKLAKHAPPMKKAVRDAVKKSSEAKLSKRALKRKRAQARKAIVSTICDGSGAGLGDHGWNVELEDGEEIESIDLRLVHRDAL